MGRREWAMALIRRAPTTIQYGSEEWEALPDTCLEKVTAVVKAAECWFTDGEEFGERLEAEMDALRAADKRVADDAYRSRRDGHRQAWDAKRGCFRPDPRIAAEIEAEWAEWVGGDQ